MSDQDLIGEDDWINKVKARELHFVGVASEGMTTCDLIGQAFGLNQAGDIWPQTSRVNALGETGTFAPLVPMTVLPQFSWEGGHYRHGHRDAASDLLAWLRQCFEDVVEAERVHVRIGRLFVDLNPWGGRFDYSTAFPIAVDVLTGAFGRDAVRFHKKHN